MKDFVIKEISKKEYYNLDCKVLFSDEKTDRCFAILFNKVVNYKFSWQSDKVAPFVLNITDGIICLGIDQNFIIIDININKILFEINLDYFFYEVKIHENFIYIITELEIIQINKFSYKIVKNIYLSDFYENIDFLNNKIIITNINKEITEVTIE